jgi:hypothetical protein
MLPSHKIKMAAYYVKNKKWFRRHLGLSCHFDFLAWQQFLKLDFFALVINSSTIQKYLNYYKF